MGEETGLWIEEGKDSGMNEVFGWLLEGMDGLIIEIYGIG
jgi:hypothetical protein